MLQNTQKREKKVVNRHTISSYFILFGYFIMKKEEEECDYLPHGPSHLVLYHIIIEEWEEKNK